MRTTAEQLMAARDVISDPEHWVVGVLAADRTGNKISLYDTNAVRFCANGALCKAKSSLEPINYLWAAAYSMGYMGVLDLNDNADHNTVMEMFDLAIRMAKESE